MKLVVANLNITDSKKKVVVKKILLPNYQNGYSNSEYENVFHGTSYSALESIAKHGLKKPREIVEGKRIKPVQGHISLGI